MCGIAGLLDRSGAPADRQILLRMLRRIEHRGPDGGAWLDDDGVTISFGDRHSARAEAQTRMTSEFQGQGANAALGHQRLAITDLSRAGRQPMSRENARWWIVFNGAVVMPISFFCLANGPKYLSGAEVAMFYLLETVLAPVWVWLIFAEVPSRNALIGGTILIVALIAHSLWQLADGRKSFAKAGVK